MHSSLSTLINPKWQEISVAIIVGIFSHIFCYKNGEHHMETPIILWLHVFALSMLLYGKTVVGDVQQGILEAVCVFASYLGALFTSMIIYRTSFHRLRHFPGPRMASVTKLWHTAKTFDCQNHLLLDKLHKQYGDFVRTGKTPRKPMNGT